MAQLCVIFTHPSAELGNTFPLALTCHCAGLGRAEGCAGRADPGGGTGCGPGGLARAPRPAEPEETEEQNRQGQKKKPGGQQERQQHRVDQGAQQTIVTSRHCRRQRRLLLQVWA